MLLFRRWRYTCLLVAVLCMMTVFPLVGTLRNIWFPELVRAVIGALFSLALLLSVIIIALPRHRAMVIALTMLSIVLHLARIYGDSGFVDISWHVAQLAVIVYVVAMLIRALFTVSQSSVDTVAASLCAYLFMGLGWAIAYSFLDAIQPNSFQFNVETGATPPRMEFTPETAMFPIYYSLVTMTTLGYGDIVPATDIARSLASSQALIGQIYIVVVVSRLVGSRFSNPGRSSTSAAREE